ncbi:phosphatidylinositol-3-phosphatase myotubularin-1 [Phtheirospermum japonicum]|uniref:Phosphatidylinositol-3-phosphatase myotubularin-1 n=1 Tax=Phtheirospermum japonicum TaxID=374723 RepID=A0A830D1W0_9LAMI|nr:phosphatidylinositol-3-phosphatase myotubularin-1 [Phtheirospermum japonicum]
MSLPKTRSGRTTSLRESDLRLSESERIEGAGSWDAIEWTKVDPVSRSVPQGLQQFLLEAEQIIVENLDVLRLLLEVICDVLREGDCGIETLIAVWFNLRYLIVAKDGESTCRLMVKACHSMSMNLNVLFGSFKITVQNRIGYGVVLVNTDEAGTLFVTNFRLLFLSDGSRSIIGLGTIPLATIEKFSKTVMKLPSAPRQVDKTPSQRLLQVIGKDMRIIVFGFRPRTKQGQFLDPWRIGSDSRHSPLELGVRLNTLRRTFLIWGSDAAASTRFPQKRSEARLEAYASAVF